HPAAVPGRVCRVLAVESGLQPLAKLAAKYPSLPGSAPDHHGAQPLQQLRLNQHMRLSSMNPRTLALSLACLAALAAAGVQAQGLRPAGGSGASLSKALDGSVRAVPGNTGVRSADFIVAVVN